MTILGPDLSHHQGSPNFAQIKAAGNSFVVLKATEGVGYTDPMFTANRRAAHAAGLIVGIYHFARGGAATGEAAYFTGAVGALQPGEFLVLDWEITYAGDHVAWCKAWLDAVAAKTGVNALIYMNQSAMNAHNWMPVSANHGLWLAVYDNSQAAPASCNCWAAAAMKQYSDRGAVPGVAGGCDVNVFYGSAAQLLAYGKGGTPAPAPAPTVQEDDVRLIRTPDGAIWKLTETDCAHEATQATVDALSKAWGVPVIDMDFPSKDAVYMDAFARRNGLTADIVSKLGQAQAPTIDEAKLAAALLADPAGVQALGAAIAAHLKLTSS